MTHYLNVVLVQTIPLAFPHHLAFAPVPGLFLCQLHTIATKSNKNCQTKLHEVGLALKIPQLFHCDARLELLLFGHILTTKALFVVSTSIFKTLFLSSSFSLSHSFSFSLNKNAYVGICSN